MKSIKILSHEHALEEVKSHSKQYNVIFITNPGDPFYKPKLHDLILHAKKALVCQFMDIEFERDPSRRIGPQKHHVEDILKFAEDKDNIICCCHAGISRSSATAFVICCKNTEPKDVLSILKKGHHFPNDLIIKYGSEILNKPEMITIMQEYKQDLWKF